ncbi:MAG: DUF134 domain-containing protein [Acutalibacteraceae bacterium]|jgi:predicted DNA-binding protein (UPF0251 family)|nr:DUF134 domain-containing protein [Clostridiales bacterium]
MPRPRKWRKVCSMPENSKFGPLDITVDNESIINMTVEEYEVIRLIDVEGMTQEECSKQMAISRTTVQGIYNDARKKLADSLVNGKALFIDGGDYLLCDGKGGMCGRGCRRRQFQQNIDNEGEEK